MQLQNFLIGEAKNEIPKDKPIEEDALEKLWRPNIRRQKMHRTGEVRVKYDPYVYNQQSNEIDEEFKDELEGDFQPLKMETKQQKEDQREEEYYERMKKSKAEREVSYFDGAVKVEKTKEERNHLKFVQKVKKEYKDKVFIGKYLRDINVDDIFVEKSPQ